MVSRDTPMPRTVDLAEAYALAAESIPGADDWGTAVRRRVDGSSCHGVFAVLHELRAELLARVGDLACGGASLPARAPGLLDGRANATHLDRVVALELAIEHLPRAEDWQAAWRRRDDGTCADALFASLADLRLELHARLGELQAQACPPTRATTTPT